ncbi:acetolactate synthase small subunit [Nevskia sp.]|uniref:acetolactate synthase small subunit n=1 Tax=Nevskia sp. TaxID=1929292 RepID=UPI002600D548|nr:acetolactate synthase small subunit [Nevskia sp.]
MRQDQRHIISILLQNEAGALARVAGMFSARGYNIESLSVAPTHDPTLSRLTLVTYGSDAVVEQIVKQSRKLVEIVEIVDLAGSDHLEAELVMLKVAVEGSSAREIVDCVRRHRGLILDETETTRTVQLTGTGAEVNGFLAELSGIAPVLELVRSGTAALARGAAVLSAPA